MQIVIDIPDEKYDRLLYQDIISLRSYVENGTVLPKGHGRLIDADVLCDYFWDNRSKLYTHKDLRIVIDDAPTIIEKDGE